VLVPGKSSGCILSSHSFSANRLETDVRLNSYLLILFVVYRYLVLSGDSNVVTRPMQVNKMEIIRCGLGAYNAGKGTAL